MGRPGSTAAPPGQQVSDAPRVISAVRAALQSRDQPCGFCHPEPPLHPTKASYHSTNEAHTQTFPLHLTAHRPVLCQHSNTSLLCHRGTRTSGTGLHTCFTCIHFIACCFGNVLNPTRDQLSPLSTHESHPKGRDRSFSFAIPAKHTDYTQKNQSFSSSLLGNLLTQSCSQGRLWAKLN